MRIDIPSRDDVIEVALNMRPKDREELLASFPWGDENEMLSSLADRYGLGEHSFCAYLDGDPIVVGAVVPLDGGMLALGMFATPDFNRLALALARFVNRRLLPRYRDAGFGGVICLSLDTYYDAHRWMSALGLDRGKVHEGIGAQGQDFIEFRKDWRDGVASTAGEG